MQKIPVGIIHGRFQPPHNGHIRFMLLALEKAEHLIIGICTPTTCTEEEAERTGYPCAPLMNPFSFDDRVGMIAAALAEADIPEDRYSFIPFPSDYQYVESLIPRNTVFFMSVTSTSDERKIEHLQKQGYKVEVIMNIPEKTQRESGTAIRNKQGDWENMIPKVTREYIQKNHLEIEL